MILLTVSYYHRGTRLNAMERFCLGSLCSHPNVLACPPPCLGVLKRFRCVQTFLYTYHREQTQLNAIMSFCPYSLLCLTFFLSDWVDAQRFRGNSRSRSCPHPCPPARSCPRSRSYPCSYHRFLPPASSARFSRRYHVVGQAPGLAFEATGYFQALPPVYRDYASVEWPRLVFNSASSLMWWISELSSSSSSLSMCVLHINRSSLSHTQ